MKRSILNQLSALSFLMVGSLTVCGQSGVGGVHINSGLPVAGFESVAGASVFPSVSVSGLIQVPKTPFFAGGELGFSRYGTALIRSSDIINGTEHNYRIRRNNDFFYLSGVIRLMPETPIWIRPFVEGQLGGIYAYTRSDVKKNIVSDPLSSGNEARDLSHIWQLGGGLMIPVSRSREANIELRVNYLKSGRLEYLAKDDAAYDEQGDVTLTPRNASFELLQPAIALRVRF